MSVLGYFQPGHVETLCYAEGLNHPLARTALHHEVAHENLTSWSSCGLYSIALSRIAFAVRDRQVMPDPLLCLAAIMDASRETHEGFATFSQLTFIAFRRFGFEAARDAFLRIPEDYRVAAGKFYRLQQFLTQGAPPYFPDAVVLAVRSFAIAALNIDIFERVARFHDGYKLDLLAYLAKAENNPDLRLSAILAAATNGELDDIRLELRSMLASVTSKLAPLPPPPEQSTLFAVFSRAINAAVLRYFKSKLTVDLMILDRPALHSAVLQIITEASNHYDFNPELVAPPETMFGELEPSVQADHKFHSVEFADTDSDFGIVPFEEVERVRELLLDARAHGAATVIALTPADDCETTFIMDAAARHNPSKFRIGVVTSRAYLDSIEGMLSVAKDTSLVVFDALLLGCNAALKTALLNHKPRLYIYCARISVDFLGKIIDEWLGADCSVLLLRDAIGFHSLLVVSNRLQTRSVVAAIAEDATARYEHVLSRRFRLESRAADPFSDAEPLLALWAYAYGPCAQLSHALRAAPI